MKQRTRSPWAKLQDFTYSHKKLSIALSAGMFVAAVGSVATAWYLMPPTQATATAVTQPDQQSQSDTPAATTKKYYSPLTGVPVADEAATKRQVTGIMIENSPSARPQSGIKEAGVVFEAIAEGGITRLATLHQEDRPGTIGPVRSIRPYYLDWMAPFDAAISHVGGSANALATVRNGSFKDIDQFFNGGSYSRATDRVAPHNVYTNSDRLDALNQKKGFTSSTFTPWARKKETPVATPNANTINMAVSSPTYNVRYEYDKTANSYNRFIGGAASTDRELGQVKPKVVIALKVPTHLGMEDGPREQMTTDGHNDAFIFQDGTVIKAVWRKESQKEQMVFYDKNGHIVALNPGQTWITVVAPEKAITWQ
jgi:hypothetical protein